MSIFWVFFGLSLSVFVMCNLLQAYFVRGRMRSALSIEREHARRTARLIAEEFRKEIAKMIQIVGVYLAISFNLTAAAAVASFTVDKKRPASVVVFLSSALPTICFALFLKMLGETNPDAHIPLEDQQRYMEALLFKAFFIRRVGYHLFFFTAALCVGWIQPIAMFGATLVLMLIYIIIDVRAFFVSHQPNQILPNLLREDPIRAPTLHIQVSGIAALPQQNDAAQQVETH